MAKARVRGAEASSTGDTPAAEVVHAATQEAEVTDDRGRDLVVRKLTARKRMQIFAAIGPELSQNQSYWGMAMLAATVVSIDGDRVQMPSSRREIEALVERLGDEGLAAAGKGVSKMMGIELDEKGNVISDGGDESGEIAYAKN